MTYVIIKVYEKKVGLILRMNKKELNEIRKNFCESSGLFTINHVLTAFVSPQKDVTCKSVRLFNLIPEDEGGVIMETLKKVLGGTLGKGLVEYEFPRESYDEGGTQALFYSVLKSKFKEEKAIDDFLEQIVSNIDYETCFAVISAHCSYSIMKKSRNEDINDESVDQYNFIVTAISPVDTGDDGLYINEEEKVIQKKANTDKLVRKIPSDGFIYPVFSDRSPDVNHIMYFTKTPNKPNYSVVDDVLGCKYKMTPVSEKQKFRQVIEDVVDDELDYTVITTVNEKIAEAVEYGKNDTEPTVVDDRKLFNILTQSGVSEEKLEGLSAVFKETVGDEGLTASNLVETKTVVKLPDITISIKKDGRDKIRTSVVNGRKCLVIDIDDPAIEINGINTLLETSQKELQEVK